MEGKPTKRNPAGAASSKSLYIGKANELEEYDKDIPEKRPRIMYDEMVDPRDDHISSKNHNNEISRSSFEKNIYTDSESDNEPNNLPDTQFLADILEFEEPADSAHQQESESIYEGENLELILAGDDEEERALRRQLKRGPLRITPFNLDEEREIGNFDESGQFLWKKKESSDDDIQEDNVFSDLGQKNRSKRHEFEGYTQKDMEKARESQEKQRILDAEKEEDWLKISQTLSIQNIAKELIQYMESDLNETPIITIKRLGKSPATIRQSSVRRYVPKASQLNNPNRAIMDKITWLCSSAMSLGYSNIYEEPYDRLKILAGYSNLVSNDDKAISKKRPNKLQN